MPLPEETVPPVVTVVVVVAAANAAAEVDQAQLDPQASQENPETPVPQATQVDPDDPHLLLASNQFSLHADLAPVVSPEPPAHQAHLDNPDLLVSQANPEATQPQDHQDLQDQLVSQDNPETPELQDSPEPQLRARLLLHHQAHQESKEHQDSPDTPEVPASQEALDSQALRDHQEPREAPETTASPVHRVSQDSQETLDTPVSARSTAPWTAVCSSPMARDAPALKHGADGRDEARRRPLEFIFISLPLSLTHFFAAIHILLLRTNNNKKIKS